MSLALISSTAVGLAYAGRRAASLKPYSSLNESHYLCQRWALLQLLTCTAQRAQTSAAGRGENEQPASETLGTWIQWTGSPLVNGCWKCEYATLQLELKETVKWKTHTQHQFIFPSAIPYMCVNFFTFKNNSRLLPSTKTQKYDFNKTRLALINSYTDFYIIKWIPIWQCGWRRHGQLVKKKKSLYRFLTGVFNNLAWKQF